MQRAEFIYGPRVFLKHTAARTFIGPGTVRLPSGEILMAAPWGGQPAQALEMAEASPVPRLYRSEDGGRTWREAGLMRMEWRLSGTINGGGVTFLRLQDGRLAFAAHRHVQGFHGGGLPVVAFSEDEGQSWTPARLPDDEDAVYYVMNDRLIQMRSGRLVLPVSHMPVDMGTYEGDRNVGLCFYSEDGGETWRRSSRWADLEGDLRGMAEPCVAEVTGGRLLMLSRTGAGVKYQSWSDDSAETWSTPEPTTLTAACSSLTLKTLPDGRLIVFYNHAEPLYEGAFFPRNPLTYAISADGGRTWSEPVLVDDAGLARDENHLQHIYPSICFTDEGMLAIYSTHKADPQGKFGAAKGAWRIGGAKCCLLPYPA